MGARRTFRRGGGAQKSPPHREKSSKKAPTWSKRLPTRRKMYQMVPIWRKSSKKPHYMAKRIVWDFPGGKSRWSPPPPCQRPCSHLIVLYLINKRGTSPAELKTVCCQVCFVFSRLFSEKRIVEFYTILHSHLTQPCGRSVLYWVQHIILPSLNLTPVCILSCITMHFYIET